MKTFSCREAGFDCDWSVQDNSEDTILAKAEEHGKQFHGLKEMDEQTKNKVRSKIHDVKAA